MIIIMFNAFMINFKMPIRLPILKQNLNQIEFNEKKKK